MTSNVLQKSGALFKIKLQKFANVIVFSAAGFHLFVIKTCIPFDKVLAHFNQCKSHNVKEIR